MRVEESFAKGVTTESYAVINFGRPISVRYLKRARETALQVLKTSV